VAAKSATATPAKRKDATREIAVSVEAVLWAALIGIALALRLASLDRLPFTTAESARAFNAWLVSQGSVPAGWTGDLTSALTSHLFRIFGSGDTIARLTPALRPGEVFATFHTAEIFLNRVTSPQRDRYTETPEYKVTAVRLKAEGRPAASPPG